MKVFLSPADVPRDFGPSVVTIGNFDGVHIGHREILRRVVAIGRERGLVPTVLTFDPHPARVLAPDRAPRLIMTMAQRLRGFEAAGIEAVLILPFSLEFARLTPEEFAGRILAGTLRSQCVMVGDDFRFGYKQSGNTDTLSTLGEKLAFALEPVAPIPGRIGPGSLARVSSTAIRAMVAAGRVSRACRMMGAPFALEGDVVIGFGIGSKQTVPTLNLAPRNELLPGPGVYVTRTRDLTGARVWRSITNVGNRPTFGGRELTVETFLLDAPPESAPPGIEVSFLAFVRGERKFDSAAELKAQILRDAGAAGRYHRRAERLGVG